MLPGIELVLLTLIEGRSVAVAILLALLVPGGTFLAFGIFMRMVKREVFGSGRE